MIHTKEEYREALLSGLSDFTYWATPCNICHTVHYTFDFQDTVEHAKHYHPDSTWADDRTFA